MITLTSQSIWQKTSVFFPLISKGKSCWEVPPAQSHAGTNSWRCCWKSRRSPSRGPVTSGPTSHTEPLNTDRQPRWSAERLPRAAHCVSVLSCTCPDTSQGSSVRVLSGEGPGPSHIGDFLRSAWHFVTGSQSSFRVHPLDRNQKFSSFWVSELKNYWRLKIFRSALYLLVFIVLETKIKNVRDQFMLK